MGKGRQGEARRQRRRSVVRNLRCWHGVGLDGLERRRVVCGRKTYLLPQKARAETKPPPQVEVLGTRHSVPQMIRPCGNSARSYHGRPVMLITGYSPDLVGLICVVRGDCMLRRAPGMYAIDASVFVRQSDVCSARRHGHIGEGLEAYLHRSQGPGESSE
ncbi:hypothetical protein OH77DRAFT_1017945 [Trametes cingulata]|nr:hypothetical protein OH77DRAFT_1017945 [Trametes cingulata]